MNPKIDEYLLSIPKWQEELEMLRMMVLDCGLTEELKWGVPCYTFQQTNVLILGAFKEYCTISFLKGVLLNDAHAVLSKPGENTQAARLIRFTNLSEIIAMEAVLKTYIYEAIEVEKAGLKVDFQSNTELVFVAELQHKLNEDAAFRAAFEALTPGRQKGYQLYFSAPKQSKTRESRIEKYRQQILDGKGFHDCTCGFSQKMPTCDGSHNRLGGK